MTTRELSEMGGEEAKALSSLATNVMSGSPVLQTLAGYRRVLDVPAHCLKSLDLAYSYIPVFPLARSLVRLDADTKNSARPNYSRS